MALKTASCRARRAEWLRRGSCAIAVLAAMAALAARAAETEEQRAQRLQNMTAQEKESLLSKKERFDKLEQDERDRLRALHRAIEATPNAPELEKTLDRYHAWLATLSPVQRDDLRDLPAEERIVRIKELLKVQETQRFQAYVSNLDELDRQAIFKWLGEFVTEHEDEIVEQMPEDQRKRFRGVGDPEARQRWLGMTMAFQRHNPKMPTPSREDYNRLLARLSSKTIAQIEQAPAIEQPDRVREMVGAAIFSRQNPPVAEEELRQFYTGLKPDQREKLEGLEPEEFKRRLTSMYHAEKRGWQGGRGFFPGGSYGPPGGGRPGEAPRGDGPPRGDGRRPKGPPRDGPPVNSAPPEIGPPVESPTASERRS